MMEVEDKKAETGLQTNRALLREVPLFAGMDERELTKLAGIAHERQYPKGAVLFFSDEPGDALFVIKDGSVKIYLLAGDGREKTLAIFGKGDFFGEMALLDEGPRSAIAETLEETHLLVVDKANFTRLLESTPRMALKIIRVLTERLRQANAQLEGLAFTDVRTRVAGTLKRLAAEHGVAAEGGVRIGIRLTHQQLANLAGTSRETVTRILCELQDEGELAMDGKYIILKG
ncbi:MAG: Crp/Fnr family transcriptional regulator [Firmicutes bacterium]|nr:Crp/Fnr family transcriptional regulator [Bacillota bacterium]